VENSVHERFSFAFRGTAASDCRNRQINGPRWFFSSNMLDEWNGGGYFADRHGVQPDGIGLRPIEGTRYKTEALAEAADVIALRDQAKHEVQEYEREKCELKQPV